MRIDQPKRMSFCHTFLYIAAGLIGLSCGRCGAELVVTLVNVFAGKNIIEEDSYNTEAWMAAAGFGLSSILFAYFYLEHRHMHQTEKMTNRLHAFAAGNVLINNNKHVHCIRLNPDSDREKALMQLATRSLRLWEAISGAHGLKGDAVGIAKQFDTDLKQFCAGLDEHMTPEQATIDFLCNRLTRLCERLQRLKNYLMVQAAIEVPSTGRCCWRRYPSITFAALQGVEVAAVDADAKQARDNDSPLLL